MIAAPALNALNSSDGGSFARVVDAIGEVGDPVGLGVVLLFWLVFAALFLEFVKREVTGVVKRSNPGAVQLEIAASQPIVRFVPPLVALVVVVGLNAVVFAAGFLEFNFSEADLASKAAFWLFYAIGHFLLLAFVLRAVRNRPFFVLSDRGFIYEPGDLSPGLILWRDIASLREVDLLAGDAGSGGPTMRRTLVVGLRDPDKYFVRYNPLLRLLHGLLIRIVRIQADGVGDLVIEAADLGERYAEVRALMARKVADAGGAVTLT